MITDQSPNWDNPQATDNSLALAVDQIRKSLRTMPNHPRLPQELERFVMETQLLETNKFYPFPILEHAELVEQLETRGFDIDSENLDNVCRNFYTKFDFSSL